jgi:hypothetical protein
MKPFVTRFTFLLGLLLVLTGIALNFEAKTTFSLALVLIGLVVTLVSLYIQTRLKKEEDHEIYPEPSPEEFEDKDDTYTIEEQQPKK